MKIPVEYGGMGLNQFEYSMVMELLGSQDGNLSALLSAHQSIGVPQPLKMFGSKALKQKYLPRCAEGARITSYNVCYTKLLRTMRSPRRDTSPRPAGDRAS